MTSLDNNMGKFFEWLTKPMSDDDITSWYLANNIIPELTELFRDFCLSFLLIMRETYLGDDEEEQTETKIGMTEFQNREHFRWCWNKTIENFKKENINFKFSDEDFSFFENFFYEMFYNQKEKKLKNAIDDFFKQIFDNKTRKTKSDIEIFTDIYKTLERSIETKNNSFTNT
jgi:hypothetical protein